MDLNMLKLEMGRKQIKFVMLKNDLLMGRAHNK